MPLSMFRFPMMREGIGLLYASWLLKLEPDFEPYIGSSVL